MPETSKKEKKVGSIIFRIILIVIAGLTVGYGVFSWNASRLIGNQLPMPFGFGASVVMSSSMEPALHVNDLVFVKEQDSYQVDDVIVFQDGNMLVIHRIIDNDGETIVTKGDANNVSDDPIGLDQVKGKMVFRIPYIGIIFKFIKTVPGTLLILLLAIFLLYRSRQKEREADREQLDCIVEEIRRLQEIQNSSESSSSAGTEQTDDDVSSDQVEVTVDPTADADDSESSAESDGRKPDADET